MRLIQTANSKLQKVTKDNLVNLGTIDRKVICGDANAFCFNNEDTISINRIGYYKIDVTANVSAIADGDLGITLKQNETLSDTALAVTNATAGNNYNLNFSKIIRVFPNTCCAKVNVPTRISIENNGVNIKVNTINVSIVKVA